MFLPLFSHIPQTIGLEINISWFKAAIINIFFYTNRGWNDKIKYSDEYSDIYAYIYCIYNVYNDSEIPRGSVERWLGFVTHDFTVSVHSFLSFSSVISRMLFPVKKVWSTHWTLFPPVPTSTKRRPKKKKKCLPDIALGSWWRPNTS